MVPVVIVIGVVVGLAGAWGATHRGVESRPALAGAVCMAALATLAAGDAFLPAWRQFWVDRPMLTTAVSGVALLGLTVLLVDAVIQHAQARQWRRVLARPVARLLRAASESKLNAARNALAAVPWDGGPRNPAPGQAWIELPAIDEALEAIDQSVAQLTREIHTLRNDLLAAGDELADVYTVALDVVVAGEYAVERVTKFRDHRATMDQRELDVLRQGPPYPEDWNPRMRYVASLWSDVRNGYTDLARVIGTLDATAWATLRAELHEAGKGLVFAMPDASLDGN